jgi:cation diffusion facilitator CzcD-associated flavoprotein CzcO
MGEGAIGLKALEARFRDEWDQYAYYRRPWVKPHTHPSGAPVHNVLIAGAGHCGAGLYFGLRQSGIDGVRIIDSRARGQEGVWVYYDRMESLRTPKGLTGPDWGYPSLTFRSYCEARFGKEYWRDLTRVIRQDYADYMEWLRALTDIPVENHTRLCWLEAEGDLFRVVCAGADGRETTSYARNVVLATGYWSDGNKYIPESLRGLPEELSVHSSQRIDFAALAGKRVGILGHGAGAFDCAGMALEAGASSVDLCYRRKHLPTVNPYRWFEFPGFVGHFYELDDRCKWQFLRGLLDRDQPPPQAAFDRAARFPHFRMRPETGWTSARATANGVEVETPQGRLTFDYVIFATGMKRDFKMRAELESMRDFIATWADRFEPPAGASAPELSAYAYLGPHFEFTEKSPGAAPWLKRLFVLSFGAAMSHGPSITSLSGLRYALPRTLNGLRANLFVQDAELYFADFAAYDAKELDAGNVIS